MTRHSIQIFMIGSALALLASAANVGKDLVAVKDLDPQCNETIKYQTVTATSDYLTIHIGLSQARQTERASAATAVGG